MYENENVIQSGYSVSDYITKVFIWMFVGLAVTAFVAYGTLATGFIGYLSSGVMLVLAIAELIIVWVLSRKIANHEISSTGAKIGFIAYSVINGLTLSIIFLAYNIGLIYKAFIVAALTFGVMAFIGHTTKKDLTNLGTILIMGLVGIIIATLVNMILSFFGMFSSTFDLIITYITIFIFLGLTAFDVQKIKSYYYTSNGDETLSNNLAIMGALALYLDFINIFLQLLKLFGRRD